MRYNRVGSDFITPSDTVNNMVGVCAITVTGAGDIVFRHDDGSISVAIPLSEFQSLQIGRGVVAIHEDGTTATEIVAFYGPKE